VFRDADKMSGALCGLGRERRVFYHIVDRFPEVVCNKGAYVRGLAIEFLEGRAPAELFCGGVVEYVTHIHKAK
jgi:hypothetical protein